MVNDWATSAAWYDAEVRHTRTRPFRYAFAHHTYYWLVDIDDPPRPPWPLRMLAGFGDMAPRAELRDFLSEHGDTRECGRILMLAHARVFGYVFNPLTVYWVHEPAGQLRCVIAEVHNTYGQRHRYLLYPGSDGNAHAAKEFYVSPFFEVTGEYVLRLPVPDRRLFLAITLWREGTALFAASLTGARHEVTTGGLLWRALRYPLSTLAVSARIRWHGLKLYLRGLSVVPRRTGRKEKR